MANTLTGLISTAYEALDVISRELVGLIPAVTLDGAAARAAVGQAVTVPIAPASSAADITPAVTPPDTGDQVMGTTSITITKARAVPFRWEGEEQRSVTSYSGPGYGNIRRDQIAQAMRTLVNEVEADVAATYVSASRAYGTAGTTPFGADLGDAAEVLRILKDNGAPDGDLHLVLNTAAGVNLRKLAQLTRASEAGTTAMRAQGTLLDLFGFMVRESAQIKTHTKGTGTGYLVNDATTLTLGETVVEVDTGTGTIVAGDILTFAADANNKYVNASALGAGTSVTLAQPGVRVTIPDDNAITIGENYAANLAFSRNAVVLVTRAPAAPEEGDSAGDSMVVADDRSGLAFEIRVYPEYRRVHYEVGLAWGVAAIKPEHMAILLG